MEKNIGICWLTERRTEIQGREWKEHQNMGSKVAIFTFIVLCSITYFYIRGSFKGRELIDHQTREWKEDLVKAIFVKEKAEQIYSIPIRRCDNPI